MEEPHSPISRLTDPELITRFVHQLQLQVLGEHSTDNESCSPASASGDAWCRPSIMEHQPISPPPSSPAQRQTVHQRASVQCAGDSTSLSNETGTVKQSPCEEEMGEVMPKQAHPLPPPSPVGSGGSVDLCAEIMAGHALRLARRAPMPDTGAESDPHHAPHLHAFLMNVKSNQRRRPTAAAAVAGTSDPAPEAAARPPYQDQLQLRAEQRRARQQECRRRRQERQAACREAEQRRHEEFQRQLALERQQQQEQLRARRLRQEEARRRQMRGQQALQQRYQLADEFRRRALVRRVFRAMVRHTQRCRHLDAAAELWARAALLRRCIHRWRYHRALLVLEREEAARHWHRTRLTAWALQRWRTYVHQQRMKAQAATDLSQLQRLQSALRTWQASLALSRVRRRQKMQRAVQCDVRLTCAGVLRRWRRLGDALQQEREAEARRERLRRIVREMVPDFQPPQPPPQPPHQPQVGPARQQMV